jgi:hypothetical protein
MLREYPPTSRRRPVMNMDFVALFKDSGPWALLFVGLFIWVLKQNQRREDKLIEVLEKLTDNYERLAADVKEIKDTAERRRLSRN